MAYNETLHVGCGKSNHQVPIPVHGSKQKPMTKCTVSTLEKKINQSRNLH
jgi:hypothetical protein